MWRGFVVPYSRMGEILHFPSPQSEDRGQSPDEPEPEITAPVPLGDELERTARRESASILAAREQRLRRNVETGAHPIGESVLEVLRTDADGWMDDLIPALVHEHFGQLSILEQWRRRGEIRAFREQIAQHRASVALAAMERLIDEMQPLPEMPSMVRMKARLGQLCLEELERRVPQDVLTAEDVEAIRRLGVAEQTARRVEETHERQTRTVRPLRRDRVEDGHHDADDPPLPPAA